MTCSPAPGSARVGRSASGDAQGGGWRLSVMAAVAIAMALAALWSVASPVMAQEGTPEAAAAPDLDTVPPTIQAVANVVWPATDAGGAWIEPTPPAAVDGRDGTVPVACDYPAGFTFPIGDTLVTCLARDGVGNVATIAYWVTVVDQTPPVVIVPPTIVVDAVDPAGAAVWWESASAVDNVDGSVDVWCDWSPGAFFPVGATTVTCYAQDTRGNLAAPGAFLVTVNAPVPPEPVVEAPVLPPTIVVPVEPGPVSTEIAPPTPTPSSETTETPVSQPQPSTAPTTAPIQTPDRAPTLPPAVLGTATSSDAPTQDVSASTPGVVEEPPRAALELPWPPPAAFPIVTNGGPLGELAAIWGYQDFPISQEFGRTAFSILNFSWYRYGLDYGLDGYEHPGLDVAMPAGTWLYSPVEGTVEISGGTPFYTFYGNGEPNVGELLIETDDGDQVILGHMGRIAVNIGDRLQIGQFVGLSGGSNGDHVHLEVRERRWGWYRIVDPRQSFAMDVLRAEAQRRAALAAPAVTPAAMEDRAASNGPRRRPPRVRVKTRPRPLRRSGRRRPHATAPAPPPPFPERR